MDELLITSLFIQNSEGQDKCEICKKKKLINCCNRCGDGICYNCCLSFPHEYDTVFNICFKCSEEIEKQFTPTLVIDREKLKLLKQRIKKNRTYVKRKRFSNK